jgi:hypothetical protein
MSRALWAAGVIICVAAISVILQLSSTSQDFSRWNTDWNGTSDFYGILEKRDVHEIYSLDALPESPGNVLFIVSLRQGYEPGEIRKLESFLDAGNRVVIIDEGPPGGDLVEEVMGGVRFTDGYVTGVDRPWSDPALLLAYPVTSNNLTTDVTSVLLDRPKGVVGGTTYAATGILSWVDTDSDGALDKGEEIGTVSVLAGSPSGRGETIVLSDASAVINGVLRTPAGAGNRVLVANLAGDYAGVYLDQAHCRTADSSPMTRAIQVIRNSILLKTACLLVLAGLVVAYLARRNGMGDHGRNRAER